MCFILPLNFCTTNVVKKVKNRLAEFCSKVLIRAFSSYFWNIKKYFYFLVLHKIHMAIFYFEGVYGSISKRVAGIKHVRNIFSFLWNCKFDWSF